MFQLLLLASLVIPSIYGVGCCKYGTVCGNCGAKCGGTGECHLNAANCAAAGGHFDATEPYTPACSATCGVLLDNPKENCATRAKDYCKHSLYGPFMAKNCAQSCCKLDMPKEVVAAAVTGVSYGVTTTYTSKCDMEGMKDIESAAECKAACDSAAVGGKDFREDNWPHSPNCFIVAEMTEGVLPEWVGACHYNLGAMKPGLIQPSNRQVCIKSTTATPPAPAAANTPSVVLPAGAVVPQAATLPAPPAAANTPPAVLYAKTSKFSNDCAQDGLTRITDEATCLAACTALGGKVDSFRADNWEVSPACWMVTTQFNGYLHNCGFNLGALSPSNSRNSNNELCLTTDGVAAFPQPAAKVVAQSGRCAYKGDLAGYCWFFAKDGKCTSATYASWMGINCARTCCEGKFTELRESDESEVGEKLKKVNKALRIALGELMN